MEQNEVVKETVELTLEQKLNEKRKAYRNGDILYKAISIAVIALSMAYAVGLFMGFLAEWDVVRYIIGIAEYTKRILRFKDGKIIEDTRRRA